MSVISVRPLPQELATKAQFELNETPKKLEEGITYLKEWIAKQPHLRARTDDQWLAAFLRGCKHSIERAKEKLDLFYSMRSIAPELTALKYWDPKFKEVMKTGFGLVLPKRVSPGDPRVVIVRASHYDPQKLTPLDTFAVSYAAQMITHLEDDPFVIAGVVIILDLTGLNINHFSQITPALIKKAIIHCQDASPIRLKDAYFIGMPSYFQAPFKIGMQLLNEKNKKKIHIINLDELHKVVSKDILPLEYGGSGGTAKEIIDHGMKIMSNHEAYFEEDLQYGTDEAKRPGRPRSAMSLFGVDGSFRQLDFD